MRQRLTLAAALIALLCNASLHAQNSTEQECSCLWQGSFSEVAPQSDLTVLGTVTQVKGNAVDLQLEQTLLGETWLDNVRIWMKARDYCRPPAESFPTGSRWIMVLEKIDSVPDDGFNPLTPNISFGREQDYLLSSCGGYFLSANGNAVIGNLVPSMARWDYTPKMTPVLISLIDAYLSGHADTQALTRASKEGPRVRELILDTRSFLRGQEEYIDSEPNGN